MKSNSTLCSPRAMRRMSALAVALPSIAFAHPGHGLLPGFAAGVAHPFTGLDHLAAMLALGLWAGTLKSAARWSAPIAFVLMMLVGAVLGLNAVTLPGVELGIAVSVCALGVLLMARVQVTAALAAILASMFAVFHGYAHGAEAAGAHAVSYLSGFTLSTLALHLSGLWLATRMRESMLRTTGMALTIGGALLLTL